MGKKVVFPLKKKKTVILFHLQKKNNFSPEKKKGLWWQNPFFNRSRDINKGGKTTGTRPKNWVSARLQTQHLIWMTVQYKWNKYALVLLNVPSVSMSSTESYLLSLLFSESVSDGVLYGGAWTLVNHWIPKRDLQEARDHQDQVRCVTQGNCHAPIILCCRTQSQKEVLVITHSIELCWADKKILYLLINQQALKVMTSTHQSL